MSRRCAKRLAGAFILTALIASIPSIGAGQEAVWKRAIEEASELHRQGDANAALVLAETGLRFAERELGADDIRIVEPILVVADYYRQQQRSDTAEALYRQALQLYEKHLGSSHPYVAITLQNIAFLDGERGRLAEQVPLLERAVAILERSSASSPADLGRAHHHLAAVYSDLGKYGLSQPHYERALAIREELHATPHEDLAFTLNGLAVLHYHQGRVDQALPLLTRALDLHEQLHGADHPGVATVLNNLGRVHQDQGNLISAGELHRRALEIRESKLGQEHPDVANSLNNLALVLEQRGLAAEAVTLYERARNIYEKRYGKEHHETALVFNNLGRLHTTLQRFDQAEEYLTHALSVWTRFYGESHLNIALLIDHLAELDLARGRLSDAEAKAKQALDLYSQAAAAQHPYAARANNTLARIRAALAQQSATPAALERMARVVTDLDPEIKTIEMRGQLSPGFDSGGAVSFFFRYQSPDQYAYFLGFADHPVASAMSSANKYLMYDFRRGSMVVIENSAPNIRFGIENDSFLMNLGFIRTKERAKEPYALLRVDFPSFLGGGGKIRGREVESLGGGTYRLVQLYENGMRLTATVDSSLPFAYTHLQLHKENRPIFSIETRVNQQISSSALLLPPIKFVRALFEVEELAELPGELFDAARTVTGLMLMPIAIAAGPESGKEGWRNSLDKTLGKKHDWEALEARYQRDLPKLRQLVEMPRWPH